MMEQHLLTREGKVFCRARSLCSGGVLACILRYILVPCSHGQIVVFIFLSFHKSRVDWNSFDQSEVGVLHLRLEFLMSNLL